MSDHYAELYSAYQWLIPSQFNIAHACLHRWAGNTYEGRRTALYVDNELGPPDIWSYTQLAQTSNRLANGLSKMGIKAGDRVAIAMGQRPETAAAFMAVFGMGAIAVPLPASLKPALLAACLADARCHVAIADTISGPDILEAQALFLNLSQVIGLGFQHEKILPWRTLLARQTDDFPIAATAHNTPALLLYSGTTPNKLKGAVLPHRALIGNLPGFVASQNWFPQSSDIFWTSADWCHLHGLLNALLPVLYFGKPLVATLGRCPLKRALAIIQTYKISNLFLDQQLISQISKTKPTEDRVPSRTCRSVVLPAEAATASVFQWCETTLGIRPNTVLGLPEANHIIVSSLHQWGSSPDNAGRPVPGHQLAVLDASGTVCPRGQVGELAINQYDLQSFPDPALFLGYWTNIQATQARFTGNWFHTGIRGLFNEQGCFQPA